MHASEMDPDDLVGAVGLNGSWRFFLGTVAEWIFDIPRYEPHPPPGGEPQASFRGGLVVVTPRDGARFSKAMAKYELTQSDIRELVREGRAVDWPLMVAVDFDSGIYVNGFSELPLHEYVPSGWRAFEGDPTIAVPDDIRRLWKS